MLLGPGQREERIARDAEGWSETERSTPRSPPSGHDGTLLDGILIAAGFLLLATSEPILFADAEVRYRALELFATDGVLEPMKYSFIGPFFALPLWFLGSVVADHEFWVTRFNLIFFTLGTLAFWFFAKDRIERGLLRKFILVLVGASMFPGHLLHFYGEIFTSVLVLIGSLVAVFQPSFTAWAVMVVGVANTPAAIGGLALLAFKRALDSKAWRYLLAIPAAGVLIAVETFLRRGELVTGAYLDDRGFVTVMPYSGRVGFSYPLLFGLLGSLLSFGKGLVFFAPGLFLPVRKRLREQGKELWQTYALWVAFVVGLILVYARWWAWYGGIFWGPRFLLFASVPASLALAARLHKPASSSMANLVTVAALALSCWVAASGAVYGISGLEICSEDNFSLEHLCWYAPEFSVLWHPFVSAKQLTYHDVGVLLFEIALFVRLAYPFAGDFFFQTRSTIQRLGRAYFERTRWRF